MCPAPVWKPVCPTTPCSSTVPGRLLIKQRPNASERPGWQSTGSSMSAYRNVSMSGRFHLKAYKCCLPRTVKLCKPLKSGDYKLHLEAEGLKETKIVSVCVVGKRDLFSVWYNLYTIVFGVVFFLNGDFVSDAPKFKFRFDEGNDAFTMETVTLVPANYSWMSCSSINGR